MAGFHVIAGSTETLVHPRVRKIGVADLLEALRNGVDDFREKPSHIVFLCLIYPIVGVVLAAWTSGNNALPLLFPLVPASPCRPVCRARPLRNQPPARSRARHVVVACLRGQGLAGAARYRSGRLHARRAFHRLAACRPDILSAAVRSGPPEFIRQLPQRRFSTTTRGWTLIILGHSIGFVFAASCCPPPSSHSRFCSTATSAPMKPSMLGTGSAGKPDPHGRMGPDRRGLLIVGSLPVFAGLAVVLPILGHATWHLYRRVIEPPAGARRN